MPVSDTSLQNDLREHAPLTRWLWPEGVNDAALRREVIALREHGYGGITLWPGGTKEQIGGAPSGYLGAGWMQRVRTVAETCRAQGMVLWIADDWAMPSGNGELARAQSTLTPDDVSNGGAWNLRFATVDLSREAAGSWRPPDSTPLAAWAAPLDKKTASWNEARNLLPDWAENPARGVAGFNQDVQVALFFAERVAGIDRLRSGSAQEFLELTHHSYLAALEPFFGSTIRGFITGGPPLPIAAHDELPWSPELPEAFSQQNGYNLRERLAALIAPVGEDAVAVRQHFWATVGTLLRNNWWAPLRAWCEQNRLQLAVWPQAGTSNADESLNGLVGLYAEPMETLRAGHRIIVTAGEGIFARLAGSVAALENQAPPLALWPQSAAVQPPQDRLEWQHELWRQGIGGHIASPDEPQQPFAPALESFNDEMARAHQWLAASRPAGRTGVLLATRSAWAHYHPKGHRFTRWVWEDYLSTARLLDELHFDFIIVGEADILNASLSEGQLLCGRGAVPLEMLIVPGATTLSWDLWRRLEQFVESGGKVICLGLLPRWSERGRDEELESHISHTTMLTVADLYAHGQPDIWGTEESSAGFPITRQNEREGRWACYQPQFNSDRDDARLRVRQMLKDSLPAGLETQAPGVLFARRESISGETSNLFFIANTGAAQTAYLRLRATQPSSQSALFERETAHHKEQPVTVWSEFNVDEGGGFVLDVAMAASSVRWLEWRPQTQPHLERATIVVEEFDGTIARGYAMRSSATGTPRITMRRGDEFISSEGDIVRLPSPMMLPDEWQARRRNQNVLRLKEWFWSQGAQGSPAPLHSSFQVESTPVSLWAHIAWLEAQLFLNGELLQPSTPPFARQSQWSALGGQWFTAMPLLSGLNELDCAPHTAANPSLAPPVLLVGDFEISEAGALTAPSNLELSGDSWHEQGLPFYAGAVELHQTVTIPGDWENCRSWLELSRLREGVALMVNDRHFGNRLIPPWRFEITGALRPGEANSIYLCLWNTTLPLTNHEAPPAGLLGPVRLVAYPRVEIATKQ